MSAPRKDARDGGVKRQGGKSKYGGTNGWSSKREVGGRGMYVTCVRGREKNCANDILDLLVETAAKLYPAERLAALAVVAAELQAQYAALRAIKEAAAGQAPMETAEDGTPEEENSDDEDDEDEDIETSIARELAEIRAAKGSQFSLRRAPKTEDQDKGKVKDKAPRAPFIPVFTAIDCLVFISIARPYDPVELCEAIVNDLIATGVNHSKHTSRLEPVTVGCHALTTNAVQSISDTLIRSEFHRWAKANNKTNITYSICPSIRVHKAPLTRPILFELLGACVRSLALPVAPLPDSTGEPLPLLTVSANLTDPDIVLLPIVYKNAYGLSIFDGKLWNSAETKRFNLDTAGATGRKLLIERQVKFGAVIKDALYQDWQKHYIDYSGLKRFVKDRQELHKWDDSDEADFVKALEGELDKICTFQEAKIIELTEQITTYENQVKVLIANSGSSRAHSATASAPEDGADAPEVIVGEGGLDEGDSEDDDDEETEDRFVDLEEDLANVIADVHDLGHFSHLNYTGFVKIVKKHDKKTGFALRGPFMREYLDKRPFYKENYDALIVQLSRLYNLVRTRGHPVMGDSSAGGGQSAFVRQTTKYWVHPDNYVQLKLVILKHLPVLVFNPEKPFEQADAAISSVYFDNQPLDLYLGRLEKTEGAEAIRMRWYGGMDVKTIFVERKTHREDWTGEKSVKARFPIKEQFLNAYLKGDYTMDDTFEALRKSGKKSDKEVDSMLKLAREVQAATKNKELGPVMRTFYNRTAFQLPGDARVRISFDTQLSLIREDNWDGSTRAGSNWRRNDIGIDFPFEQLPKEDKELFPYGVLEVKLQTQMGQEPPEWVRELVSSHLVEAVPKFSKFIHGCATLLPNRVDLVPFWLPQMETDIRKPATRNSQIRRPQNTSHSNTNSATPSDGRSNDLAEYTEPLSDEESNDGDRLAAVATDEAGWANLPPHAAAEAKAFRDSEARNASTTPAKPVGKPQQQEIFTKLTPANLYKLLNSRYDQDRDRDLNTGSAATPVGEEEAIASRISVRTGRVEYVSSFRAAAGKRLAIPVRIEPKVFFANERTMLSWLEFSVVVSAIGIGILSFSDPDDDIALASAVSFTAVALISIVYTMYKFIWRVLKIRNREAANYHDWYGPTALVGVLLLAIVVNFSLRLKAGF